MDFDFTDDQLALREAVARWVERAFPFERRHALAKAGGRTREVWGELAGLGLSGLVIPDEHGGMGQGAVEALPALDAQRRRRPGPFACALGHAPHQQGRGAPAVAETHIQTRMAVQHAAINQRRHGQSLLGREAGDDVEFEAAQGRVTWRPVDARGAGMDEQRHIQTHGLRIQHVHRCVVQWQQRIGAERGPHQTEFVDGPLQFLSRRLRCLQGQCSQSGQLVRMLGHHVRQRIVVDAAEPDRIRGRDEMQVGQRVR